MEGEGVLIVVIALFSFGYAIRKIFEGMTSNYEKSGMSKEEAQKKAATTMGIFAAIIGAIAISAASKSSKTRSRSTTSSSSFNTLNQLQSQRRTTKRQPTTTAKKTYTAPKRKPTYGSSPPIQRRDFAEERRMREQHDFERRAMQQEMVERNPDHPDHI